MKNLFLILAIMIVLISCEKNSNPVEYNTDVFNVKGIVSTYNEIDKFDYNNENVKIYLYQKGIVIDSVLSSKGGHFEFKNLDKNNQYKLKLIKENYITIDDILVNNSKFITMEVIDGTKFYKYDFITLENISMFKPIQFPAITGINGLFYTDSSTNFTEYDFYIRMKFNMERENLGILLSICENQQFEENSCIVYNKYIYNEKLSSEILLTNKELNLTNLKFYKGSNLFIKVRSVKNSLIRNKNSQELDEPILYQMTAS